MDQCLQSNLDKKSNEILRNFSNNLQASFDSSLTFECFSRALVISDVKLMKEVFSHPASTGKYKTDTFLVPTRGPYGVINTEGELWYEQRQFLIRTLVKHGFGSKTALEPIIVSEAHEVVEWIKNEMAKVEVVSLVEIFRIATNNTLLTLVTGERVGLENTKVSKLLENLLQ